MIQSTSVSSATPTVDEVLSGAEEKNNLIVWLIAAAGLIQIGYTIWLGLVKGDPNENRFGPPPGRKKSAAAEAF